MGQTQSLCDHVTFDSNCVVCRHREVASMLRVKEASIITNAIGNQSGETVSAKLEPFAKTKPDVRIIEPSCIYRLDVVGETPCICSQKMTIKTVTTYGCQIKGACTVSRGLVARDNTVQVCRLCETRATEIHTTNPQWAVGVTTVLKRKTDLLPRTLASLAKAGWENPRLFVDGGTLADWVGVKYPIVVREKTNAYANWWLGIQELYARNPLADRFMMVQDDVIFCKGVREYLDVARWPGRGYLNLYTFSHNEDLAKGEGFFRANQIDMGLGALALVFNRDSITKILASEHMIERFRPFDFVTNQPKKQPQRAKTHIDGGVAWAMKIAGMSEWCHNPSLVQHTGGKDSTLGHVGNADAITFKEDFDARSLLK